MEQHRSPDEKADNFAINHILKSVRCFRLQELADMNHRVLPAPWVIPRLPRESVSVDLTVTCYMIDSCRKNVHVDTPVLKMNSREKYVAYL